VGRVAGDGYGRKVVLRSGANGGQWMVQASKVKT
jgi:hypothetical protein